MPYIAFATANRPQVFQSCTDKMQICCYTVGVVAATEPTSRVYRCSSKVVATECKFAAAIFFPAASAHFASIDRTLQLQPSKYGRDS